MLNHYLRQTDSPVKGLKFFWSTFLVGLRKIMRATFRKRISGTRHYNSTFRTDNVFQNSFM